LLYAQPWLPVAVRLNACVRDSHTKSIRVDTPCLKVRETRSESTILHKDIPVPRVASPWPFNFRIMLAMHDSVRCATANRGLACSTSCIHQQQRLAGSKLPLPHQQRPAGSIRCASLSSSGKPAPTRYVFWKSDLPQLQLSAKSLWTLHSKLQVNIDLVSALISQVHGAFVAKQGSSI
jgi:hypothetical protein